MPGPAAETVREVFCKIIDLTPEKRAAARDVLCGNDAALAARVQALLDAHGRAQDFLDQSFAPADTDISADEPPASPVDSTDAPATIGPYTLLKLIGEGGLGSVYLAAQEHPIRRRVAVKIIKRGMETRQLIARFEVERQSMALMEHPGIARVFEAGTTHGGIPYFAMEFIDGPSITRYCDEKQLTVGERLALFVQVCDAVQHAHQKGVIHRDIKPSNVLVATVDDKPIPKIIDFGIAKAAESTSLGHSTLTGAQQMVGTPLYMSPEQVSPTQGGVDTRSDIYSLGVLLYELLTGATPFDSGSLGGGALPWEMQRVIREIDPPSPSNRVTALEGLKTVAAQRATDPARLRRLLRGELDWVVMKAIARDRELRYGNASSLAADVSRYLRYEPVQAGPPGLRYRARRFIRRNKLPVAVAISLVLGLTATTVGMLRAVRAERSEAREKSAAINELWNARLLQARAGRWSGKPGQRLDGLAALSAAAAIRPSLALRNEAIGCLALPDIEPLGLDWYTPYGDRAPRQFDGSLDRYLAVDQKGQAAIYRTADHLLIMTLPDVSWKIGQFIRFSPNGRYLAATYDSGPHRFRVWDLQHARPVLELDNLSSEFAVDFIGRGDAIAVGRTDNTIGIYQLPSNTPSAIITCGCKLLNLKAQPQGKLLAAWGDDGQLLISVESGKILHTFPSPCDHLAAVAWNPNGRYVAFAGYHARGLHDDPNWIYVTNAADGERLSVMQGHLSVPEYMNFSPDAQIVGSGSWDGTFRLWSGVSGKLLLTSSEYGPLIQASEDGRRFVAGENYNFHLLRSVPSRECRHVGGVPSDGEFRSGDFSRDGSLLACAANYGVRTWDVETARETSFTPAIGLRSVLFSPDGSSFLVSDRKGIRPMSPALPDGQPIARGPVVHPDGTGALAISADGRTAVYGLGDASVMAVDLPDLKTSVRLGGDTDFARFIAVSPDGAWAASSTRGGPAFKVWDLKHHCPAADLKCISTVPETGEMAFSPDGRWLVTGETNCYSWWEVGTWKLHHRIPHKVIAGAPLVAFSKSGLLAASGPGYSILLLDPETGAERATLEDPEPHGNDDLAFSKDGSHLAVMHADGIATIWDLGLIRRELAAMKLDW